MSRSPQATLGAKKRADHQISAIRPSMLLTPDSPRPRAGEGATSLDSGEHTAVAAPRIVLRRRARVQKPSNQSGRNGMGSAGERHVGVGANREGGWWHRLRSGIGD